MKGIYPKYRVYKEPPRQDDGIPAEVYATYMAGLDIGPDGAGEVWLPMEEVNDFFFVLKPMSDKHAKTALVIYSLLVEENDPELAKDLMEVLR